MAISFPLKADDPNPQREFLTNRYQQLWDGAIEYVRNGQVSIDPQLARRQADQRRSLTVLVRPSARVREKVAAFLDQLRRIDPEQYYYDPSELHVTVLSLFTGTVDHARLLLRCEDYLAAVDAALCQAPSFAMEFTGVTLSREAILIQGFPETTVLNDLREALRGELRARHLTEGLDGRYVLQTAHMTAVRFRNPLRYPENYAAVLAKHRAHAFGGGQILEANLVRNDWYLSQSSLLVLRRYPLR